MKIRLAVVRSSDRDKVVMEVQLLRAAVAAGDMEGVDAVSARLRAITDGCPSVDLSEQDWREFLAGVRKGNPHFKSDYLLPGKLCIAVMPGVASDDTVLELPFDG